MTDIVERLRDAASDLAVEAADEIERLREEIKTLNRELDLLEEKSRHD